MTKQLNPLKEKSMAGFFGILKATIIKELLIYTRYIPNLAGTMLQIAIRVVFFMFLSTFAAYNGKPDLHGGQIFTFFGSAFLLYIFFSTSIWAPLNSVTTDLYNGTLEYIYITPSSKFAYYYGTGLTNVLINIIFFIPVFIFLMIYCHPGAYGILFALSAVFIGVLTCISMGVLISLIGVIWKQVNSITGILSVMFEFLAGAYAPVQQYSGIIKGAAFTLPFTWGYDIIRFYLLGPKWQTLAPISTEWAVYIGMMLTYTIIPFFLLKRIENKMLNSGLNII